MELRRALLLFAVVLGLAAIASSLSRPTEESDEPSRAESPASRPADADAPEADADRADQPAGGAETIRLEAGGRGGEHRLALGVPTTVVVAVKKPGQVQIEGLGLVQPAEPLTPARFDVLVERPLSSEVLSTPAGGGPSEVVGTLVAGPRR